MSREDTQFDFSRVVTGEDVAKRVVVGMVAASQRVAVIPYPDDRWAIYYLKDAGRLIDQFITGQ